MALRDLTYFRQLTDYATALEAYIMAATGLGADRVVFAAPDVAKRKLKEKLAVLNGDPTNGYTLEIDQFVSYYFVFGAPGSAEYRQSPMASFFGHIAKASGVWAHADYIDMHVEVDIWGGPDQSGKSFIFEKRMMLNNYSFRHRRIAVQFRDLVTRTPNLDPNTVQVYDVNCWYEIERGETTDHSQLEQLFNQGTLYRSTFEFTWLMALYSVPGLPGSDPTTIAYIERIIAMFATAMAPGPITDPYVEEWSITTTTTSSSSSSTSTTTLA